MARGFREASALLERLPQAARERLGYLLAEIGAEISAAQKAAVPRRTGHLAAGLDVELLLQELRVRMGLLTFRGGRNSRYYGRFVEFGRRAQTVRVTRGTSASPRSWAARRKHNQKVRGPYTMRVSPMAARPFVHLPGAEDRVARRTAEFWSEVLSA